MSIIKEKTVDENIENLENIDAFDDYALVEEEEEGYGDEMH